MAGTIIEKASDECRARGHILRAAAQFPNPNDAHLAKVLVQTADDQFVVWTFNVQDRGFHNGQYSSDFVLGFLNFTAAIFRLGADLDVPAGVARPTIEAGQQ